MGKYIIPDIHGCLNSLRHLVEDKLQISIDDQLFFLGDYIDRGPYSAGVVEYIMGLIHDGYRVNCLMGNHEQMMLDSFTSKDKLALWMINAGITTINSYLKNFKTEVLVNGFLPQRHLNFFQKLDYHLILEDDKIILVHGGINYYSDNPFDDIQSILWNRAEEVPGNFFPGYRIIHGHTPMDLDTIRNALSEKDRRLFGLDAGCVFRGEWYPGTGYLTALSIDNWELVFVKCVDKW
ncbi:MAG: serine/threonine protein phosphatase [Bacteroidales bacterium]|nr:serine/threonine protein phosphatase [Bacteroidales bacterium]HRX31816.1 metallophosphoesterase family protein [Tenuifilaceae bacterium]